MIDEKRCAIITGGEISDYNSIDVSHLENVTIISADAGYIHAKGLGLKTDVLIGDFDTLTEMPDDVAEIITFPKEKDDTDTMLAVKLALERGYNDIEIYGALGDRLDHSFANIQSLAYINSKNARGRIISERNILYFIENEKVILPYKKDFSLSLFSYSEKCIDVTIKGVKYPLDNALVTQNFPLCVCNEIIEKNAEISVKSGKMLIILSKI